MLEGSGAMPCPYCETPMIAAEAAIVVPVVRLPDPARQVMFKSVKGERWLVFDVSNPAEAYGCPECRAVLLRPRR